MNWYDTIRYDMIRYIYLCTKANDMTSLV